MKFKETKIPCSMCGEIIGGNEISEGGNTIVLDYRNKNGSTLNIRAYCRNCAPKVDEAFITFAKAIGAYEDMAEDESESETE